MATILEENRKHLRKAMTVQCGFRESTEEPTSITPSNDVQIYEGLANLNEGLLPVTIMDLAGDGFLNDGNALPMQTDTDSFRYGYMSSEVAKSDGTFDNPMSFTFSAPKAWDTVTVELRGQYGEKQMQRVDPIWSGSQTTITIDKWIPGERVCMTAIYLGNAWVWDNADLVGVTADLHSVNTEIGGELELSSIEIQAYEPEDYTDIIGRIPKGAPIWYTAGYPGDMSTLRKFYMSEDATWDDNILTVRGQDASMLLENVEIPVELINRLLDVRSDVYIAERVRRALASISYDEIGNAPFILIDAPVVVLFDSKAARSVISEYTGVFRNENELRITYVDAGTPTLWIGINGHTWTIYADEIAELNIIVEHNKNELKMTLPEFYLQWNSDIETITATKGKTYFVDLDPPVISVSATPTPTEDSLITPNRYKFKAGASTDYTIAGREALKNLLDDNNPYTAKNPSVGESYSFDFEMPLFVTTGGYSLTKRAVDALLNRSNILYEFTYRGNPHIQPRDVLTVEVATWADVREYLSGLYPANDLYPGAALYPSGTYEIVRRMVKKWVTMTVDTVTLEHSEGGGLSSKIRARKGAV